MLDFRKSAGSLCVLCALLGEAQAQEEPTLSVTRDAGAEHCSDTSALLARLEKIRGRPEAGATTAYHVTFSRDRRGLSASIRTSQGTSFRVLRDRGPGCAALEQATAVTLALLLDSDSSETPEPVPAPQPEPVVVDRPPVVSPVRTSSAVTATLSLGGGGLTGVLAPIAPAFMGDVGIGVARFRTSIGALWVPAQTSELAPGSVRQSLLSGVARTCLAPVRGSYLRLDVCSGIYAGILNGQGRGYTRNESVATPWLALPFELTLASVSPGLGWELGATALVPLRRHQFSVDGVGVSYESLPVGSLLTLRIVGRWLL